MSLISQIYSGSPYLQEAIKTLRTNISFASIDDPVKTIMVTSTKPSEGKSTIASALCVSLAEAGSATLLVENDLRRPRLANYFKIRCKQGLSDVLMGTATLNDAIVRTEFPNLFFLDVGRKIANPVDTLATKRYKAIVEAMQSSFRYVVIDTPPLAAFVDAAIISTLVDKTIYVIRAGRVDKKEVVEAVDQLRKANADILGVVLNGTARSSSHYDYYTYYDKGKTRD